MRRDRTKRATAEAATHDRHRIFDHRVGGNRLLVLRVRLPRVSYARRENFRAQSQPATVPAILA